MIASPAAETNEPAAQFVTFAGTVHLASGHLADAAIAAWRAEQAGDEAVLIFNRITGEVVDVDLRGSQADVLARYEQPPSAPKRGRPSLGVVPREVTLLPRHWEWLARQPGGASTTLRRLVEAARKADTTGVKEATDAAYRFMAAIAGDLPGFEEASRALFAGDRRQFGAIIESWPPDVRDELHQRLDAARSPTA